MISLSLHELKLIRKSRNLKDFKNKSENGLIKILSENKPKINLFWINISKKKIKEVKKDFSKLRYRFSKEKIYEFRRNLYNIKIQKTRSLSKIKETKNIFLELEKSLSSLKKYYDYDDIEYQGIKDIRNLFDEINEDYYKPTKTKSTFNGNYIEYESKGNKIKN